MSDDHLNYLSQPHLSITAKLFSEIDMKIESDAAEDDTALLRQKV